MAAVCYLGFSITWFWAIGRLGLCFSIIVPLYQIWCKNVARHRNYGPKSKSKMAVVRHLGFLTSSYRTIHEIFSLGYIGLSNFMLIRCIVLKIWRFGFEFFFRFGLKCLFTPPKFWFLGVWIPKRDWSSSRPKKAHPWPKPHLYAMQFWCRSVHLCDVCVRRRNQIRKQKGEERNFCWRRFPIHFGKPWLTLGIGNGKIRPNTSRKPFNRFWRNLKLPPEGHPACKTLRQRGWSRRTPSLPL